MKTRTFCIAVFFVAISLTGNAQSLQRPAEGKSLVYITRVSSTGALINFKFFDGDKYVGKFGGYKYVIIECDPGEHLFWASAENRDFLPATLEANKTYVIDAWATVGAFKARVMLRPVVESDEKYMKKLNKLLLKGVRKTFEEAELNEETNNLKEFIDISLGKYESAVEKNKDFTHLTSDMDHSE